MRYFRFSPVTATRYSYRNRLGRPGQTFLAINTAREETTLASWAEYSKSTREMAHTSRDLCQPVSVFLWLLRKVPGIRVELLAW